MAMKKTSGGDFPHRHGAEKSFWTLPISGRRRQRIAMCFWKSDRTFRFFLSGGLYRRRGSVKGRPGDPHHRPARARARPCPWWCGHPLAPFHILFGYLEALVNIWTFGFCFVQF
jgi:hypothetical protein